MRDTWLVKNNEFVFRRRDPTAKDIDFAIPYVWINSDTLNAFVMMAEGVWSGKPPDRVITTEANTIYVIENEILTAEEVLFGGEDAIFGGENALW